MTTEIDYENPWTYNETPFGGSLIGDNFGFVYCITNTQTNRKYIGRKYFWSFRKPPGKSRRVRSESDWRKYYGSSDEIRADVRLYGKPAFQRHIISLHTTKGQTNYEETRQLFINNVLTEAMNDGTPAYYNSNILGRYMRKDYFGTGTCA
jgi:hypothetical protein